MSKLNKSNKQPAVNHLNTDDQIITDTDKQILADNNVTLPMGYSQIKRYLPHRYPFMLVDRVISCKPGKWILGHKNVTINEPFFPGHFPEEPIMPGVLIVEAMAQLAGILGFISNNSTAEEGDLFLFAGIDKVRFRQQVVPGDTLVITAETSMQKQDVFKFKCFAHVEGALVASAQVMIARQKRL